MAEEKPAFPERKIVFGLTGNDLAKPLLPAVIGMVFGWFTGFSTEQWCYFTLFVLGSFGVWLIFVHARVRTVESAILDAEDKPYHRTLPINLWFVCVGVGFTVVGMVGGFFLHSRAPTLFPPARVTRIETSNIQYFYGPPTRGRIIVPNEFYKTEFDEEPVLANHCLEVTVCLAHAKSVAITALEFQVTPIPFAYWHPRKGVYPLNAVMPYRYSATLKKESATVKAVTIDDNGNPDAIFPRLNETTPFALFHVQFEGATGLYEVIPVITLNDKRSEKPIQVFGTPAVVAVLNFPEANELKR